MSAAGSCFPPPAGLVGWWPGEGNANDIQGTNNGTLQGGATATAVGVVGAGLSASMAPTAMCRSPTAPRLRPTNLTLEAWVRFQLADLRRLGGSPARRPVHRLQAKHPQRQL